METKHYIFFNEHQNKQMIKIFDFTLIMQLLPILNNYIGKMFMSILFTMRLNYFVSFGRHECSYVV